MASPAFQEPVLKVVGSVQSYMESSTDYIRLHVFKTLMRLLTSLAKSASVGVLIVLGLVFLSIAGSLALGDWLGSYPQAFTLTGVFYLLAGAVAYRFRSRIDRWVLQSFSDLYWNK
jgi:hypothetical protein